MVSARDLLELEEHDKWLTNGDGPRRFVGWGHNRQQGPTAVRLQRLGDEAAHEQLGQWSRSTPAVRPYRRWQGATTTRE